MNSRYLPERVVSLQPSATVTLAGLGLSERIVACTKWCVEVCPQIAGRDIVADSWTAQSQQILAAKPDLVIAAVPYQVEAVAEILKAGIPFLALAPHSLGDVYHDIAAISRIMGVEDGGQQMIGEMQREIEAIRERAPATASRPRVYCEEWGKPMIHSQGWVAELVSAAGGEFIGQPGSQTTPLAVRESDPGVLVMAWCGAGDRVPLEKLVGQRGWQEMPAVKSGRVFCIPDEFLNTPAITLLDGLRALAWAIHPELFPAVGRARRIQSAKLAMRSA